jgi:hypothetical protein
MFGISKEEVVDLWWKISTGSKDSSIPPSIPRHSRGKPKLTSDNIAQQAGRNGCFILMKNLS